MTTNNRMFGNLLTTSKFLKVMSAILVACMLISLTACGTVSQQDVQPTTEHETEAPINVDPAEPVDISDDGYWHDDDETSEDPTEEPSSTEEPINDNPQTGLYTYTVYGDIQLSMDVNIDDYVITNDEGQEVFKLSHMAVDLGWWPDGINPDDWSFGTYLPDMFVCPVGDMSIVFSCYGYDFNAQFFDYPQVAGFTYFMAKTGDLGTPYYTDANVAPENNYIVASVNGHYNDLQYLVPYGIGKSFMASRDDVIVLAYLLSNISRDPGTNPFINTGLTRYIDSNSGNHQDYVLP